jgi:hypothetical protein
MCSLPIGLTTIHAHEFMCSSISRLSMLNIAIFGIGYIKVADQSLRCKGTPSAISIAYYADSDRTLSTTS